MEGKSISGAMEKIVDENGVDDGWRCVEHKARRQKEYMKVYGPGTRVGWRQEEQSKQKNSKTRWRLETREKNWMLVGQVSIADWPLITAVDHCSLAVIYYIGRLGAQMLKRRVAIATSSEDRVWIRRKAGHKQ